MRVERPRALGGGGGAMEYTQPDHVYLAYCGASTPALIITADFNRDFHSTF